MSDQAKEEASKARQDRIRRMTNQELWQQVSDPKPENQGSGVLSIKAELEWRLRKLGFLPSRRPEEGGGS